MAEELYDIYEDDDGNEYLLIDGEFVPFDSEAFDVDDAVEDASSEDEETEVEHEEGYDVYEDSDGREFIIVEGERIYLDEGDFEVFEDDDVVGEDDESGLAAGGLLHIPSGHIVHGHAGSVSLAAEVDRQIGRLQKGLLVRHPLAVHDHVGAGGVLHMEPQGVCRGVAGEPVVLFVVLAHEDG